MAKALSEKGWRGSPTATMPSRAPTASSGTPAVVGLHETEALDVALTGAKAANLARSARAGLRVIDGFVITTPTCSTLETSAGLAQTTLEAVRAAWDDLSHSGGDALVVRSSSALEDGSSTSMAGRFTSILDVTGWDAFLGAVDRVLASAAVVSLDDGRAWRAPMAVLVQRQLDAVASGVVFGIDPVTGSSDHIVLAATAGTPDRLVSGEVEGSQHVLGRRGHLRQRSGPAVAGIDRRARRRIARLAAQTATLFGSPQDNEVAIDADGAVWLLQSRPITAAGEHATGPVLGPGPVAETFPDPLDPFEQDLWVEPLRLGLQHAIRLSGLSSRRSLAQSPVVVAVIGRVAVDLELLGLDPRPQPVLRRLDPRPPGRRLRAAWRRGRLRAALPALAGDVLAATDAELASIRSFSSIGDDGLLRILHGGRQLLASLHGHEVLVGMLLSPDARASTAASLALRSLAAARAQGLTDEAIVAQHPVVLSLVPPSIRPLTLPPPQAALTIPAPSSVSDEAAELREQLRLRARWVQELTGRAAWEVGRRLTERGAIREPAEVRLLRLDEAERLLCLNGSSPDLTSRQRPPTDAPALPAAFRLTGSGRVVSVQNTRPSDGQPASAGRGVGRVVHAPLPVGFGLPAGSVLVTRTLDPSLATALPGLAGLVAETGSALSHLAILARELSIPTAVAVPAALERFPAGCEVLVDGSTGEVRLQGDSPEAASSDRALDAAAGTTEDGGR